MEHQVPVTGNDLDDRQDRHRLKDIIHVALKVEREIHSIVIGLSQSVSELRKMLADNTLGQGG